MIVDAGRKDFEPSVNVFLVKLRGVAGLFTLVITLIMLLFYTCIGLPDTTFHWVAAVNLFL